MRLRLCCRTLSRKLQARMRIFSMCSALTRTKFSAAKRTKAPTACFSSDNVGALLEEMLKMPDLTRVKVPGPPEELEKLKAPLAHFKSSVVYARNDAVALTSVF